MNAEWEDEKDEAKAAKKEIKKKKAAKAKQEKENSMGDLEKMILAKRGNAFGGFLKHMEDKYCGDEGEDEEIAFETVKGSKKRKMVKKPGQGRKQRKL